MPNAGVREHKNHILTFVLISSGALTIPIGRDEILRQVQNHSKLIKEHLARSKGSLSSPHLKTSHALNLFQAIFTPMSGKDYIKDQEVWVSLFLHI